MAARLNRMHSDSVRSKIKVSNIIDRLEKHVAGEIELTPAQVTSARVLLDKSLASLTATEVTGKDGGPVEMLDRTVRLVG